MPITTSEPVTENPAAQSGLLRHFVAFRYNPKKVDETKRSEIISRFLALRTECKRNGKTYIISIETGPANSPEGADQGMQDGFLVTFTSASDRDYYVGKDANDFDPVHGDFKKYIGELLDVDAQGKINGAFVFDFTVEPSSLGR